MAKVGSVMGRGGRDSVGVSVSDRSIQDVLCSGCSNIWRSEARKLDGLWGKQEVRRGVHICGVLVWSRECRAGGCGGGGAGEEGLGLLGVIIAVMF